MRPVLAASGASERPVIGTELPRIEEAEVLAATLAACRGALDVTATTEDVLAAARASIGAGQLFLLAARPDVCGAGVEVVASPGGSISTPLEPALLFDLAERAQHGTGRAAVRRLAVALGVTSRIVVAGFAEIGDEREVLLAAWPKGSGLSSDSMNVLTEGIATCRVAVAGMRAATSEVRRERARLADELHDEALQSLTAVALELDGLRLMMQQDPTGAIASLDEHREETRRLVADLRGVVARLERGEPGFGEPADEEFVPERVAAYVERLVKRWKLPARVSIEGDLDLVPGPIVSLAYSVIREALTNAAKHASTEDVTVRLAASDADLVVAITDRGRGFTTAERDSAARAQHVGLEMLQRRVRQMGGKLYVESKPGQGTRIVARLPIDEVAS